MRNLFHNIQAGEMGTLQCALGIFANGERKAGYIRLLYKIATATVVATSTRIVTIIFVVEIAQDLIQLCVMTPQL